MADAPPPPYVSPAGSPLQTSPLQHKTDQEEGDWRDDGSGDDDDHGGSVSGRSFHDNFYDDAGDPLDASQLDGHVTPPAHDTPIAFTPPHVVREHLFPASPQRVALLAELNGQLQDRVIDLQSQLADEEASASAKLRRLEREIEGLRNELKITQKRNGELETVIRTEDEHEEQIAQQRREERAEKLRAARERRLTHGLSAMNTDIASPIDDAPMSFAPRGGASSPASLKQRSMTSSREDERQEEREDEPDTHTPLDSPPLPESSEDSPASEDSPTSPELFDDSMYSSIPPSNPPSLGLAAPRHDLSPLDVEMLPPRAVHRSPGVRFGSSLRLKKPSRYGDLIRRAGGNKAMLAEGSTPPPKSKGKSKSRTGISPLSFVSPTHRRVSSTPTPITPSIEVTLPETASPSPASASFSSRTLRSELGAAEYGTWRSNLGLDKPLFDPSFDLSELLDDLGLGDPPDDEDINSAPREKQHGDAENNDENKSDDEAEDEIVNLPTRRTSALHRLAHERHTSFTYTYSFYNSSGESLAEPDSVISKFHHASLHTLVQVWVTMQFVTVLAVFAWMAAKRRPLVVYRGGTGRRRMSERREQAQ